MQTRKWWRLILLACLIPLVAACEAGETQTPSPQSPGEVALSQPTRTVKPIVSFTPRFTATPAAEQHAGPVAHAHADEHA